VRAGGDDKLTTKKSFKGQIWIQTHASKLRVNSVEANQDQRMHTLIGLGLQQVGILVVLAPDDDIADLQGFDPAKELRTVVWVPARSLAQGDEMGDSRQITRR
jgi:hypothetical protein